MIVVSSSWYFRTKDEDSECSRYKRDYTHQDILFPSEVHLIVRSIEGKLQISREGTLSGRVEIEPSDFKLINTGTINEDFIVDTFQVADTIYSNVYKYENANDHFESVYFKPSYGYLYFKTRKGDELKLVKKN